MTYILIILLSAIYGGILNFLAYVVSAEDIFVGEKIDKLKFTDVSKLIFKKIRMELTKVIFFMGASSVIFTTLYIKFGLEYDFYKFIVLFSVLIVSSIIDNATKSVYLIVSIVGIIGGIIFSSINIVIYNADVMSEIISVVIPIAILGFLKIISSRFDGLGGGDIEVFIFIALYISVIGTGLDLFITLITAGIISGLSMLFKFKQKYIALVPYITISTFITVVAGNDIITGYLRLI